MFHKRNKQKVCEFLEEGYSIRISSIVDDEYRYLIVDPDGIEWKSRYFGADFSSVGKWSFYKDCLRRIRNIEEKRNVKYFQEYNISECNDLP